MILYGKPALLLSPRSGFSKSGAFTVGALGAVLLTTTTTLPWLFESKIKICSDEDFFKIFRTCEDAQELLKSAFIGACASRKWVSHAQTWPDVHPILVKVAFQWPSTILIHGVLDHAYGLFRAFLSARRPPAISWF